MDGESSLIIILICLFLEGWFSGSEIALVAADRLRLRHLADSGSRAARLILHFLDRPDRLLATVILCHNLAFVTGVTLSTALLIRWFGEERGEILSLVLLSPVVLILGEMVPKSVFQEKADRIALVTIYVVWLASRVLYPVVFIIAKLTDFLQWLLGTTNHKPSSFITKEELDFIIQMTMEQQSGVNLEEQKMIHRIFSFGEIAVKEAMIPLVEVVAAQDTELMEAVIRRIEEKGFSRIPVYTQEIHNIVGVVNAFDLLYAKDRGQPVSTLMRPAFYVPEQKRVDDLLKEMQRQRVHMACVVDEYGGGVGIVTVEDLLEEIVGEIEDEYDSIRELYEELPDGGFLIDGRMEIDSINERLGLDLPKGDYETLGGFVIHLLQEIPSAGKTFSYGDLVFTIVAANNRRIKEVKIHKPDQTMSIASP